jgi:hypothetical protein
MAPLIFRGDNTDIGNFYTQQTRNISVFPGMMLEFETAAAKTPIARKICA